MSATLGETSFFEETITELTGAPTTLVKSDQRPVPLEFEYSETQLQEKSRRVQRGRPAKRRSIWSTSPSSPAPTPRRICLSSNFCSKEEKQIIARALRRRGFPQSLRQGTLENPAPRHRHPPCGAAAEIPRAGGKTHRQRGLLKVVCGTDTLGVGVNVPIRTVMLHPAFQIRWKQYQNARGARFQTDRRPRRTPRLRHQLGTVVARRPSTSSKTCASGKKASSSGKKSFVKRKPPEKGFVNWDEKSFRRLIESPPEKLSSSFQIRHSLLLNLLGREDEDGCAALRKLIGDCHEPAAKKKALRRRAFQLFRGLVEGDILRIIPKDRGAARRKWRSTSNCRMTSR
jgi:hypothetical protein